MHIDIPQAQINYFDEHGYLELEDYLPQAQITMLHALIQQYINTSSFDTAYMTGHDLWRKDPAIKKLTMKRDLAQIFSVLTHAKPLQIGFDQALFAKEPSKFKFITAATPLNAISSVGPLLGGVLINLSKEAFDVEEAIPRAPGSLLFFKSDYPLPFPALMDMPNQLFFLIAYCKLKPRYIECKADPHLHYLKTLGYGMGDHLTLQTHPLLIK